MFQCEKKASFSLSVKIPLDGKKKKERDVCVCITESLCYTPETNTIL